MAAENAKCLRHPDVQANEYCFTCFRSLCTNCKNEENEGHTIVPYNDYEILRKLAERSLPLVNIKSTIIEMQKRINNVLIEAIQLCSEGENELNSKANNIINDEGEINLFKKKIHDSCLKMNSIKEWDTKLKYAEQNLIQITKQISNKINYLIISTEATIISLKAQANSKNSQYCQYGSLVNILKKLKGSHKLYATENYNKLLTQLPYASLQCNVKHIYVINKDYRYSEFSELSLAANSSTDITLCMHLYR